MLYIKIRIKLVYFCIMLTQKACKINSFYHH